MHGYKWPINCTRTRTVVFAAQVQAGLWRRNGQPTANASINYANTNNRMLMADLDLTMLQLGAATIAPDVFLEQVLHRFGLSQGWLSQTKETNRSGLKAEDLEALAEACLALLISICAELPRHPQVI